MENYVSLKYPYSVIKKETLTSLLQFAKFGLIGVLNTLVDFVVLNLLIAIFSIGENGGLYLYFKAISFVVAVINSYFYNKFWVFRSTKNRRKTKIKKEGLTFLVISVLGFVLNVAVATGVFFLFISTGYGSQHPKIISNIAALVGTVIVLTFNFIGYKYIVFKS